MADTGIRQSLVGAWYRGAWWLWLLRPLEALYRAAVALRRSAYGAGLLSTYRAPVPVVVVGNLSVGGTGKTPVVVALVEALAERGLRAGVVCRGYGALRLSEPRLVGPRSSAAQCGDEALLIYQRTGCPCVCGPSRPAAVRRLLEAHAVDVIISDDGLQHYALQRDLEIVLYDSLRAFGNGWCLPAGPLREPLARLARADLVLSRGIDSAADIRYRPDGLVRVADGTVCDRAATDGMTAVQAVAGIAHPENFATLLRGEGFAVELHAFPDHYRYSAADFARLPPGPIIMTEKDAVKCRSLVGDEAWYLKISAVLPEPLVEAVAGLASR